MADQLIPYSDSAPAGQRLPAAVKSELGLSFAPVTSGIPAGKLSPVAGSSSYASSFVGDGSDSHQNIWPYTAAEDVTEIAPVYVLAGGTLEGETAGMTASVTIKASVEYPEGTIRPLFFAGRRTITIEPGGTAIADALPFDIPKGKLFFIRTFITKPSAGTFNSPGTAGNALGGSAGGNPTIITTRPGNNLTGAETGNGITDKTGTGLIPVASLPSFTPWAIMGRTAKPRIAAMIMGDSISRGQGGYGNVGSWTVQALNIEEANATRSTLLLAKIGWMSNATSGETIANLLTRQGARFAFMRYCTHAIGTMGTNDLAAQRGDAQIKLDLTALWKIVARSNVKAYFGTITPQSTSTDAFATVVNQTPSQLAARVAVNDWMRDGAPLDPTTLLPVAIGTAGAVRAAYIDGAAITAASGPSSHPLAAAFELADAVESSRNSGRWAADVVLTTDGTHPNPAAYKRLGAKAAPVVATWQA